MFDQYSERARRVIFMARWAAGKRGAHFIESEDLLVALVREDQAQFSLAAGEMSPVSPPPELPSRGELFFSEETARNLLQALEGPPEGVAVPDGRDMPVSTGMKKVLKTAAKAVKRHRQSSIEPAHLLAAIVEEERGPLAELLANNGITKGTLNHE